MWPINSLELQAVSLALMAFLPHMEQQHVLIRNNNMSVVLYINLQGGVNSRTLFNQAASLLLWDDCHLLSIRAVHIPSLLNYRADMLLRNRILHRGTHTVQCFCPTPR